MMARSAAVACLAAALLGCATAPAPVPEYTDGPLTRHGVLHPVAKGQTLWRIARAYHVPAQELAEVNDLGEGSKLEVGQLLWIPGADHVLDIATGSVAKPGARVEVAAAPPGPRSPAAPAPAEEGAHVEAHHSRFIWPVHGAIGSRFGIRDGSQHDGIDIDAPKGSPVVAADSGEVLYVGSQRGYGNLILVRHSDNLITVYAHNDENRTTVGAHVRQGEQIAVVGQTGNATGPHLHFEVRQDRIPRNPLFFLPQ